MEGSEYREIMDLHNFFEDWIAGKLPKTTKSFARFETVLHTRFRHISPTGTMLDKNAMIRQLWEAYASDPEIKIWIGSFSIRMHFEWGTLATYKEWQQRGDSVRGRISTVLFLQHPDRPNGLEWLHVHETWFSENPPD